MFKAAFAFATLALTTQACLLSKSKSRNNADEEGMASVNSIYPALRGCTSAPPVRICSLASLPKELESITTMSNGQDLKGILFSPQILQDPQTLKDLSVKASCLSEDNFRDWKWERTIFERSEMMISKFPYSSWQESRFLDSDFRLSDFKHSNLTEVLMESSCLALTDWRSSRFENVQIENSIAERSNFSSLTSTGRFDFKRGILVGANFNGANFAGPVDFKDTDMRKVDLSGVVFKDSVNWEGAQLSGATWMDGRVCAEGSVGSCN